jgi:hypothetical protein
MDIQIAEMHIKWQVKSINTKWIFDYISAYWNKQLNASYQCICFFVLTSLYSSSFFIFSKISNVHSKRDNWVLASHIWFLVRLGNSIRIISYLPLSIWKINVFVEVSYIFVKLILLLRKWGISFRKKKNMTTVT